MKKVLLLFVLFISINAIGQNNKVESPKFEDVGSYMEVKCTKTENNYFISYSDMKYRTINEVKSFALTKEDFEGLYSEIIKGLDKKEKHNVNLETPRDNLSLYFDKGKVTIFQNKLKSTVIGMVRPLNEKQINKVFGR